MPERFPTPRVSIDATMVPHQLLDLCRRIRAAGGKSWLVGGSVRDLLLGYSPKDFDLEVYSIAAEELHQLLEVVGRTEYVGKQFGVQKLWLDGLEIDVALPRTEKKTGSGHCGFSVQCDPALTPEKATLRRDFTINAMMFDPLNETLLDFHHGQQDLQQGILRHVSSAFAEDPLRPLRAMQFAARFRLTLHRKTAALCRSLISEADKLPVSRIWSEWRKWALAGSPSFGLKALKDSGWIECYPALQSLIGCEQDSRWHPEGDVWCHTLQVCDRAADICDRNSDDDGLLRTTLLFASLCHDLGKPATSRVNEHGRISSPGHAEAGVAISKLFLQHIGAPAKYRDLVLPLVKEHITHLHGEPTRRAVRRLADRLEPASITIWEHLVEADASGRHPAPPSRPAEAWLKIAEELQHQHNRPKPILSGKMLIELGHDPGPGMGGVLDAAYQAQLDGVIVDTASAVAWYRDSGACTPCE